MVDRTDRDWKAVAYADDTTEAVVEIRHDLPMTSAQLSEYGIDDDQSVAVDGYDQLTELERSILPADHNRVDFFAGEPFDLPPFHVFDSSADVVDAVMDTVTAEHADDVAVVLAAVIRYSSLVESALDAANIPYYGGPGFDDDPDHRAFIRLLRTAFRGSETTVADVRPICARLGVEVHNWRHDVLRHCLPESYDEERRLLHVAITRAESRVLFAAGDEPNAFLESLPVEVESVDPKVESVATGETMQAQLPFSISPPDGPVGITPHDLMDDSVFQTSGEEIELADGRGKGSGSSVHEFAEEYALNEDVTPSNADERRVKEFLDGLDGVLYVEQPAVLPLEVDGERVSISGLVDLVHVTSDRIEIVDYKTDLSRRAEEEYRKQLSVYYHVLTDWFRSKDDDEYSLHRRQGTRGFTAVIE